VIDTDICLRQVVLWRTGEEKISFGGENFLPLKKGTGRVEFIRRSCGGLGAIKKLLTMLFFTSCTFSPPSEKTTTQTHIVLLHLFSCSVKFGRHFFIGRKDFIST